MDDKDIETSGFVVDWSDTVFRNHAFYRNRNADRRACAAVKSVI